MRWVLVSLSGLVAAMSGCSGATAPRDAGNTEVATDAPPGVDLAPTCGTYCQSVARQCGRPAAACAAECVCVGDAPATCRTPYAAYLACATNAVLTCPSGAPAVL